MNKRTILFWSGGLDSTALLLHMVARPVEFPKVDIVSCEVDCTNNVKEDKAAREAIIKQLDNYDASWRKRFNIIDLKQELRFVGQCIQAALWAFVAGTSGQQGDDHVEFYMGYIKGDDFWHFRTDFEEAVRAIAKMGAEKNQISFVYPWEWQTKMVLLHNFVRYPNVFHELSWGGDTAEVKLKEKDALKSVFTLMVDAAQDAKDRIAVEYKSGCKEVLYIPTIEMKNEEEKHEEIDIEKERKIVTEMCIGEGI
jgi:hypothetical protein